MQGVFQLANIARPGVLHQPCQRLRGQTTSRAAQAAGVEREKMVRQYGNILATLAQRRQRDEGDIQAIVEVFAETTLADGLHQVHVGGGDHPHVHLNGLARADAGDFALLQNAQQFDLKRQAKLADFIEQQGAALRRLEPAGMALYRAGKRPFFMAEQLRFRQAFAERAAVDGQKRPVAARAMVMQVAGDDLLTGAGFADNQHGRLGGGQFIQQALKRF